MKSKKNNRSEIEKSLLSDEHLVWEGQPESIPYLQYLKGVVLVAVVLIIFGVWLIYVSLDERGLGWSFVRCLILLGGIWFFIPGVTFFISPFIQTQKDRRTFYILTDKRVMAFYVGRKKSEHSYWPNEITDLQVNSEDNGVGTVLWGEPGKFLHGFFRIRNPQEIKKLIQKTLSLSDSDRHPWRSSN